MRPLFSFFVAVCWMTTLGAAEGPHLFILSGQSNMARMDPSVSFTPALEAAFGADNVIVAKSAKSGQPIREWYKNWKPASGEQSLETGKLYAPLMTAITQAVGNRSPKTVTFLWMQGERDSKEGHGAVYGDSLQGLLDQLQNDLGRTDLNVVIGRLSDAGVGSKKMPDWDVVRAAQMAFADNHPRGAWVNTDDLNDGVNNKGKPISNDLHYTKEGYAIFGTRLAEQAIALIRQHNK